MTTYGIQVNGADTAGNAFSVIDSTTTSTLTLGPEPGSGGYVAANNDTRNTISGSVSSQTALPSYNSTTKQGFASGDIVFGRPQDNVAEFNTDSKGSIPKFASNSHYVIMKISNALVTNVNGTAYGIVVNNSAGSSLVMLDSRKISSAMNIIKSHDSQAFTGGAFSELSTEQKNANLIYDGSGITAARFKNTYVSMQGGATGNFTTTLPTPTGGTTTININTRIAQFYFDHSAQKIYYTGHFFSGSAPNTSFFPLNNIGTIIVGEFIT